MAFWWARYRQNFTAGDEIDPAYKNVIMQVSKQTSGTFADMTLLPPWNDPQNEDQAGEITEARFNLMAIADALFYDGFQALPRIQYNPTPPTLNDRLGSYADPTDDQSVFTKNVELTDPRPIITFRFPDQAGHTQGANWDAPLGTDPLVGEIILFRNEKTTGEIDPCVKVRIEGNAGWNSIKRMDFASVPLAVLFTAGVGTFRIDTSGPGRIEVGSRPTYKVASPLQVTVETDVLPIEV